MADNLFSNPPLFKPEGPKGLTTTDRKIFDLIRSRKLHQLILDFEHGQPIKAKALSLFPADTPIEDIPQTQISELKIKKSDSGINRIECLNEIPLNE